MIEKIEIFPDKINVNEIGKAYYNLSRSTKKEE
jgi:hypothetical protein